jgi:hypothetical protein
MSMTSPPFTTPAAQPQQTTETLDYPDLVSDTLEEGETPTNVVVTLTDTTAAKPVELVDAPVVVSPYITQRVRGSALKQTHIYLLKITFTGSVTGETFSDLIRIICPPY